MMFAICAAAAERFATALSGGLPVYASAEFDLPSDPEDQDFDDDEEDDDD